MNRRRFRRKKVLFSLLLLFSFIFGLFPSAVKATNAEVTKNSDDIVISENVEENVAKDGKVVQEERVALEESKEIKEAEKEVNKKVNQSSEAEDENDESDAELDQSEDAKDKLKEESILQEDILEDNTDIQDGDLGIQGDDSTAKDKLKEDNVLEEIKEEYKPKILSTVLEGIQIKISAASGVLPDGTKMTVRVLSKAENKNYSDKIELETGTKLNYFTAFDITLLNKEGKKIQPNGDVSVNISGLEFLKDNSEIVAYHIDSKIETARYGLNKVDESVEINEINAKGLGDEVTFDTNHFSIYGVGEEIATATYNFYVGAELKDTQIVLEGEMLKEPKTPEKIEKKKFIGWQIDGGSFIDFTQPAIIARTDSITIKVNAIYEDIVYVYFQYDDNEDAQYDVLATKELIPGNLTNATNVPLVVNIPGKVFAYWSLTKDGEAFDFNTPIDADTNLYAVLADRWKVNFDAQGGSPLLPKTVIDGGTIGSVSGTTTRAGYSFKHWSKTEAGAAFDLSTPITEDLTLFAVWQAATANYSVIYWQENADDTDYTYKETVILPGPTESTIVLPNNRIADNRYTYFSFKEYDTGKIIKGDGSTVVNVYYSRNEYTIKFNLNQSESTLTIGGQTYTGSQYSFTAKYESDISELWPTATNIPDVTILTGYTWWGNPIYTTYQFYAWPGGDTNYVSKRLNLTSDLLPTSGTTRTYTGSWRTDLTLYTLHYMIERLPEETPRSGDKQFGSKWYREDMRYSQQANASGNWSAKTIAGVTNVGKKSESGRNEYFFYDRNSYDLNFYNATVLDKKVTLKYGSSISGQNYIPARPNGVSTDYVFIGWFTNPDLAGNPYDFTSAKMPENNLALYSKWAPPVHSLKYYKTPSDDGPFETIDNIPSGSTISRAQLVGKETPAGLTEDDFVGWYWNIENNFIAYDFNTPVINNDYELYPVWRDSSIFEVTYHAGLGTGNIPEDGNKYKLNAAANVLEPADLTAPNNLVFIGWNTRADGTGTNYYPNDKLTITGNITLFAQWGDLVPDTTLTYKANGGVGEDVVVSGLKNNDIHIVNSNPFTRVGYTFKNWKDEERGKFYLPGAEIIVGNGDPMPNIVYAQWEKIKIDITATKSWTGGPQVKPDIELELYRDGVLVNESAKLIIYPSTTAKWKDLDQTDEEGHIYDYTIKEKTVLNDYTSKVSGSIEDGFTVTNTYTIPTNGSYTANKVWVGGPKPIDDVKFQLYRTIEGGEAAAYGDPVQLVGDSYEWTGLEETDINGNEYIYSFKESSVPSNYTATYDGNTVTNTYTIPKNGSYIANKVWDGGPKPIEDVKFQLYRTIEGGEVEAHGDPVQLVGNSYEWTGLEETDIDGNEYNYSFKESSIPSNYTATYDGNTVTNTYRIPKNGIYTANKVWVGGPKAIEDVKFQLYRTIEGGEVEAHGDPVQLVGNSYEWTGLEETDIDGNEYIYSFKESSVPSNYTATYDGNTVTNTYTIPTNGSYTAYKVWEGGPKPTEDVKFQLYRTIEGGEAVAYGNPVQLVGNSYKWTGLEETDIDGNEYIYSFKESSVPSNYTATYDGNTVTNTYTIPTNGSYTAYKVWEGGPKPVEDVKFQLYRTIEGEEAVAYGDPVQLVGNSYEWTGLEETDIEGNEYIYSFKESSVPSYYTPTYDGNTVTNTYTLTELEITKLVTGNIGDRFKDFTFTVTLPTGLDFPADLGDGYVITPSKLNEATFTIKHGEQVTLVVPVGVQVLIKETNNEGYTVTVDGQTINSEFLVIVPREGKAIEFTNNKTAILDTGVSMDSTPYMLILILVFAGTLSGLVLKRKRINFN